MDVANAFNTKGIKLIVYFAGLNGYMKEPNVPAGFNDNSSVHRTISKKMIPSAEIRKIHLEVLKGYANRFGTKIAGWWFDGIEKNSYGNSPNDWWAINYIVHKANPKAVIAFSYSKKEQACIIKGIFDYTGGDIWCKQDHLLCLIPKILPP